MYENAYSIMIKNNQLEIIYEKDKECILKCKTQDIMEINADKRGTFINMKGNWIRLKDLTTEFWNKVIENSESFLNKNLLVIFKNDCATEHCVGIKKIVTIHYESDLNWIGMIEKLENGHITQLIIKSLN